MLAAGLGTRISALAMRRPKPLLEVAGRSLLEWNLLWLAEQGVERVWINLHYEGEAIRCAIGAGERFGLEVRYSEERTLLGTAGAWKRLEAEWTGTALVVYGDNLMRFDLDRLRAAHARGGAAATVALFDPAVHAHSGVAGGGAVLGRDGNIVSFVEGAATAGAAINAGVYLLAPEVSAWIGAGERDFGRDVLPRLAAAGTLRGHVIEKKGFCLGLDTPEAFVRASDRVAVGAVRL